MLFYSIPQSLCCVSYVAKITLARKLRDNKTLLGGRNAVLLNRWKGLLEPVNSMQIDSKETLYNGLFSLTLKLQGNVTDLWSC